MTLKEKVNEVKHLVVAGAVEELDARLAGYLTDGWELLEAKFINLDTYNKIVTVFWIIKRSV